VTIKERNKCMRGANSTSQRQERQQKAYTMLHNQDVAFFDVRSEVKSEVIASR
jgi:hypothetical protein